MNEKVQIHKYALACVKAFLHLNKYNPTSFQKNKYNKMPSEISKYRAKATENI